MAPVLRSCLALLLALLPALAACDRSDCDKTCRHVAECKHQKAVGGERLPGEPSMPADPTCLSRCEAATPEFAACEGKKRECAAVLQCMPYR